MSTTESRAEALDALRGVAIVWMVAFHAAFDLNHFGWIDPPQQFLKDPFWTWQRVAIVSLFMGCAGASQALAAQRGQSAAAFWARWRQIALCAALVSVATWVVFPTTWIRFGVLHGLALMVVLARWTAGWPSAVLAVAAALSLGLPHWVQLAVFDNPWAWGVGLGTRKPVTEDYAPLLPWMGCVWAGLLIARRPPLPGFRATGMLWRCLQWLGRRPLRIYMLHQPLLWGVLLLAATMRR